MQKDQVVDHAIDEHQKMKQALEAWEKMQPGDAQWVRHLFALNKFVILCVANSALVASAAREDRR